MARVILMLLIRRAYVEELPNLTQVERSAASLFREVGLARIANGDTMEPDLLDTMFRDGTDWAAVDDKNEPVAAFLAPIRWTNSFTSRKCRWPGLTSDERLVPH
jgi:hypothetical protein